MYGYLNGVVTEILNNRIIIDVNGVGYNVYVPNPYSYQLDNKYKVFLYNHIREDEVSLYGFCDRDDLDLFLKLINVKGLGPKLGIAMFATCSANGIKDAIERENILYLTKIPKVGEKIARQIILDLKGKLTSVAANSVSGFEELVSVLENLGYKQPDIKKVLPNIDSTLFLENQIKEALKLLMK